MLTFDHTFRDTGITVHIRKVSPFLLQDIDEAIPQVEPPMQEVDYGEPRGKVQEANYADPGYLLQVQQRKVKVWQAYRKALIRRGVVPENDDWKQEVAEYRAFILAETGRELDEKDDWLVYILRICIGSTEDLNELEQDITTRSMPTQEAIDKAKSNF